MHPPLFREHKRCGPEIGDLLECHKEHSVAKFWGKCNDVKTALDKCLKVEKEERRKANADGAKRQSPGRRDVSVPRPQDE
ncbi:hypothetical protein BASA81_003647 [Batrachochytrium salamandrivorans]|nr:hypothetical protein BASA81_003647 [Batrachochytrium salamandrivorans]